MASFPNFSLPQFLFFLFFFKKKIFADLQKAKKKWNFLMNLGSEDRMFGWLAWAIKGAFSAPVLVNAFSSCAGGSWKTKHMIKTEKEQILRTSKAHNIILNPWRELLPSPELDLVPLSLWKEVKLSNEAVASNFYLFFSFILEALVYELFFDKWLLYMNC